MPMTTTIFGCTIAISSISRARHSGAESEVSATGHLMQIVP